MGISCGAISLLGATLRADRRSGSVITFGVQKVAASPGEASLLLSMAGIEPVQAPNGVSLHQEELFRMLGYDSVESLDYYDAEGPTHIHDLNRPVPPALQQRFDLVYDGGTTEHCFAVQEVLSNAIRLARPGGRVIHHLPLNNWVDHGFYQFSPTLFFDFYEANGFDELRMSVHFIAGRRRRQESFIAYDPRTDGSLPYCFGGKALVMAFFSARKTRANGAIEIPIQGRYRRAFGSQVGAAARKPFVERLRNSIRKRTFRLRATRVPPVGR